MTEVAPFLSPDQLFDTVIVGAGPAGLSAAMMLGRARRRVLLLDDGHPRNRFASHMNAVVGFDGAPPTELRRRGRAELTAYDVTVHDTRVVRVDSAEDRLTVHTAAGAIPTRSLVDASGAADELADIPGLAELWGDLVLHCPYCHGWEVREKRIAVIATPGMGLFQAQLLRQWTPSLTAFVAEAGDIDADARKRAVATGTAVDHRHVRRLARRSDGAADIVTDDDAVTVVDAVFTGSTLRPNDAYLPADLDRGPDGFLTLNPTGRSSHERIWAVGNAAMPFANVPMSMGSGSAVGGAVNLALIEEDAAARWQAVSGQTGTNPRFRCAS